MRQTIIAILITILLSISGVEAALRAFDPLGVVYNEDFQTLRRIAVDAPHGYTLPPGTHYAARWSYTVLADGTRLTPGRTENGPRVTFVGDSVTFGYGVNDGDVWVSRVAAAAGIDAVNEGRTAYSAVNVLRLLRDVEGCVVFLTFPNDPVHYEAFADPGVYDTRSFTARTVEALYAGKPTVLPEPFNPAFEAAMAEIASRSDTLILAFDDEYGRAVADTYGAVLIPWYTERVSYSDAHANAAGNRQIADAATPVIADWLRDRDC